MTYQDTRIFRNGDGIAVALPAEFGFDADTPVRVPRRGRGGFIAPLEAPARDWLRDREILLANLRAIGPIVPREERDVSEIPERPGL